MQDHFAARDDQLSIVDVTLGYELRCAQAIPYDVDYTRTLGYGAVRFLLSEPADGRTRHAGFICVEGGHLNVLPFDDLRDPPPDASASELWMCARSITMSPASI